MFDKNIFIINTNQKLTFSSFFAKTTKSSTAFLPGCSLASLGTEIVYGTLELLKMAIPDIGLSSFCCGKPSTHINGGADFSKRFELLVKSFKEKGVKRVVTACPNCYNLLCEKLKDIEIISIWQILDDILIQGHIDYEGREMIIHDPCVTRRLPKEHQAVRSILGKMNIKIVEFKHSKDKTICCGQKNMLMVLDKPKAMKVLSLRAETAGDYEIVSYCSACVQAFKSVDKEAYHVLELLLKTKGIYSWKNRRKVAKGIL